MDRTCSGTRPARALRRLGAAAVAVALTLAGSACTTALQSDNVSSLDPAKPLDGWPVVSVVATTTSPAARGIEVDVNEVLRSADGLTTALLDVRNGSNEDVKLGDLFGFTSVPRVTLYDAESNVEHAAVRIDDDIETGGCLCSDASTKVPSGEAVTMYVTYTGVDPEIETVRVTVPGFAPVDQVPVVDAGPFESAVSIPVELDNDPNLQVAVKSVTRHDEGTLVTLAYINAGSAKPIELNQFPDPGNLSLVDAEASAIFLPRMADWVTAVATPLEGDALRKGETRTIEVLMSEVPRDTESVILRGPRLRRSFPIPVSDERAAPELQVPAHLREPEIYALQSPSWRYESPKVATTAPAEPSVAQSGPELPEIDVSSQLTAEAQPGWTVGVRGVVRGPGSFSTLLLDLTNDGGDGSWPEGLGATESRDDLGALSVIDPVGKKRYGVYLSGTEAFSADARDYPSDGETVRLFAVLPELEGSPGEVTVDVPGFGQAEGVPVVNGPRRPDGGEVAATMRVRENRRLRMDVLDVSRLDDGNGTLVRTRLVNESDPDSVRTPLAGEGSNETCDIALVDPATGKRYDALPPCAATRWVSSLDEGESLVHEVRFPELPASLDDVVLSAPGYFPSGPVAVTDDAVPWYLTLPDVAEEATGAVFVAAEGSADGAGIVYEAR